MKMTKAEAKKATKTGRVTGWAFNKVMPSYEGERRGENINRSVNAVRLAMTPATFDREEFMSGIKGRYEDDGQQRFIDEVTAQGLSDDEILAMQTHHRVISVIYIVTAVACLCFAFYCVLSGHGPLFVMTGFSMGLVSLLFTALAAKHDFSEWQIRKKRFSGFLRYITDRIG